MSRSPKSDAALFAAVMRDAKPLARKRKVPRPAPAVSARSAAKDALASPPPEPARRPALLSPGPLVTVPNPGIDRRTAERLRKGQMGIERRLDLHGMTQAAAHAALDRAIASAWREGLRMLLVITGKGSSAREGSGVLRHNLPRWLAAGANAPCVLRVEPARPQHGGSGAFYVLLRRQRS